MGFIIYQREITPPMNNQNMLPIGVLNDWDASAANALLQTIDVSIDFSNGAPTAEVETPVSKQNVSYIGGIAPIIVTHAGNEAHDVIERDFTRTSDGEWSVTITHDENPPAEPDNRYTLRKLLVLERLEAAGLVEAAFTAMGGPGQILYEKWSAATLVENDNPDVLVLLDAIGADPAVILAPE